MERGVEGTKRSIASARSALDLDDRGSRQQEGLLDTNSWRLTVGFLAGVVLLAAFAAATTNFEPAPIGLNSGMVVVDRFTSDGGELQFGRRE